MASTRRPGVFDLVNVGLMLAVCFSTLYPVWYILVNSVNDGFDAMQAPLYWWPRLFSLENYQTIFRDTSILRAFGVSAAATALATSLHVGFTSMVAYGLSKRWLLGRRFYVTVGTFTLFFSGGLIPYFLLIRDLGLFDKFLVYVIPGMFSFYNLLIFMAFFRQLPVEMEEAARIEGANDFQIYRRIAVPLSTAVLAAIALFVGVWNWNDYFTGVIFINNPKLLPIQTYLYKIISQSGSNQMLLTAPVGLVRQRVTTTSIKMATMVVTTTPIIVIYPFLQRYFVKGMLLGSVKG